MKGISLTRVLLAGLVAGILVNLTEFVLWGLLLQTQNEAMLAAHGLAETSWAMAAYLVGTFVGAFVLAFTYAGFRSTFGAGRQSALAAAGVVWVLIVALPTIWNAAIGLSMGTGSTLLVLVYGLVEASLAGLLAAWVYDRKPATAAAPAGAL
jgi:hypothetical protein